MENYEQIIRKLAYTIYGLLQGDDPDEAYDILDQYDFVDVNGEWIYDHE